MKAIQSVFHTLKPHFVGDGKFALLYPVFEGAETFFYTPDTPTTQGAHVRDAMDLKRLMIFVDFALLPAILFACWNIGYQAFLAEGMVGAEGGVLGAVGWLDFMMRGAWHFLPVYAVTLAAGGTAELIFCIVRKHEINEGFLVSSLLFPLTLPPTIPLWMVAIGIIFGIVIGKEVFGGVGMNVLNPALTARAFVFFTYPAFISGAKDADGYGVWDAAGAWAPTAWLTPGLASGMEPSRFVDGYSGATPLLAVSSAPEGAIATSVLAENHWSWSDLFYGFVPGSMGETSALAALIGAVILIAAGLASWRIMVGGVAGLVAMSAVFYFLVGGDVNPMFSIPPWYHLVMGSFAFGIVFMATDPVSAAITPLGRFIYGFLIGVLVVLVRVVNPAYPEGVMLAILFMNVFAPLIDYFVVKSTTRRRVARMATA